MNWYGARAIYQWATPRSRRFLFEERVVAIRAEDDTAALDAAQEEAEAYASANGVVFRGDILLYLQDGDNLIDRYEVWSVLLDSDEPFELFYANRYRVYEGDATPIES